MGLLALSCCLQVKFTKSKWPVCFSVIGEHRWALGDVCWEAAAVTEEELCFGRRAGEDGAFDTPPLSSL